MNIKITDVSKTYKTGKKALQKINLSISSPNFLGLLGPNGAGKSTLMQLLVGGLRQSGGDIQIDGVRIEDAEKSLKARLGYLPQNFGLYDELTVYQFLAYMCTIKGVHKNQKSVIDDMITRVTLTDKRNSKIRTLSGGQRQRVGIAQALLGKPELIILDEPTVGLDPEERIKIRNLFAEEAKNKIVILSTHIIEDIHSVCGSLLVIHHGETLFSGSPQTLIAKADGHVGLVSESALNALDPQVKVTSQSYCEHGLEYRVVMPHQQNCANPVNPSLEDAYVYLLNAQRN